MIIGKTRITKRRIYDISLPIGFSYDGIEQVMPVRVLRGNYTGISLFLSAGIHGDEILGIHVIHEILRRLSVKNLHGTLITVPCVNTYGLQSQSRYLPDRRDLNRSFPGSSKGSLAGRLAHTFLDEIVGNSDFGIDLHTAAINRTNLPQIRTNLNDEECFDMAERFCAPVTLHAPLREGSLRQAALKHGCKVLLYEAGEALRTDHKIVSQAVDGILSVMHSLSMIAEKPDRVGDDTYMARSSYWLRAPRAGVLKRIAKLGSVVNKGQLLCKIRNIYGDDIDSITAQTDGVVIGMSRIPLCNDGDAIYHIATIKDKSELECVLDDLAEFESF